MPAFLELYFKVDGALALSDASAITSSLVSRLNIAQYDTSISFANHPWFFTNTDFPIRKPLIYPKPIARDQAFKVGSIGCFSMADNVRCSGPYGQASIGLDGR